MINRTGSRSIPGFVAVLLLFGCAGTETLVDAPEVRLISVELEAVSFNRQTFLLGFDVSNPNPFPLPVKAVKYRVMFDDQRFAGGETAAAFTVPAGGEDAFQISVDIDILNSMTHITSLLQGGVPEQVSYELQGSLAIDIPFTRPIPFSTSGMINVQR
jgi:LEA14-like dessication related protein